MSTGGLWGKTALGADQLPWYPGSHIQKALVNYDLTTKPVFLLVTSSITFPDFPAVLTHGDPPNTSVKLDSGL